MASAARELRYERRGASYGNLAYDLDLELRERELRHAGELPRQREAAVPAPKVRSVSDVQVRQRQHMPVLAALGFAVAAALAAMILFAYVQLNTISGSVVALRQELARLEKENVVLVAQHEQMFDLNTVKAAAEAAGMTKPNSAQVCYIDLSGGDTAVVYKKKDEGLLSRIVGSLNHGVYAVVEYFD